MAGLRDVAESARRLGELARELHAESTSRDGDFGRMAELADVAGESADALADTFTRIDGLLTALAEGREAAAQPAPAGEDLVEALSPRGRPRAPARDENDEGLTKDELYARARVAGIPGRSKMSREELIEALRRVDRLGD